MYVSSLPGKPSVYQSVKAHRRLLHFIHTFVRTPDKQSWHETRRAGCIVFRCRAHRPARPPNTESTARLIDLFHLGGLVNGALNLF